MQYALCWDPGNLEVSHPATTEPVSRHILPLHTAAPPPFAMATNLSAADALIGERVVLRTKQSYESKVKAIAAYYTERLHRPLTVPVQRDDILGFFGWLIDEKHKNKPAAISTSLSTRVL